MTNLCDVCGKPATQSMLRDLFGKSDERRFVCSDHGFRMRDPADVAEIERLRAALAMVVKYGAAMGTAQWDVCRRALGNEQTGNEPGVGVLPGQVIAYQNGKIEGLQAKLAEIHKWADAWSKPPHSDASESDKGWYWAAQEVQNLLDPNPQGASRDASLPLTEKCPQCGLQMFNWPGQMTKCSKCLHEWHMNTLRTGEQ